jgi:hypothetical protein
LKLRLLAILTLIGIFVCKSAPASAEPKVSINFSQPPATCPATINFFAQISGPDFSIFESRQLDYEWIFDDDLGGVRRSLTWRLGVPTQNVTWQRTFKAPHSGWVSLRIISPLRMVMTAPQAKFNITCAAGTPPADSLGAASIAGQGTTSIANPGTAPVRPSPEDCRSYSPIKVAIVSTNGVWHLIDGETSLHEFASEADAKAGLVVARAHHAQCFIGRGKAQQMEYWK